MATVYYAASSLDGFIADPEHSLDWLLQFGSVEQTSYPAFIEGVGAIVMGATTYEWILEHEQGSWPYTLPMWVFTHRDLPASEGVTFVQGDVRPVHAAMVEAAGGKDIWVVGGGDLAADFAEAGLLDRVMVSIAPVTLGRGRPLFPRKFDLRLTDVDRNRAFACLQYDVVGPRRPSGPPADR